MLAIPLLVLAQFVSSHAPSVEPVGAGGLSWTAPRSFALTPSSSAMRVATYTIAAASGDSESAEVGVFYFGPGQGGTVESNVTRWQGQFAHESGAAKPTTRKTTVNGIAVTLVTAEGTYASGMPGGSATPKKGYALSGAIAEGPNGTVFFKLVGPKKTVAKAAADFDALVKSLKKT